MRRHFERDDLDLGALEMRIKAKVAYDGSAYFGYQSQSDVDNVQDRLEKALSVIHKRKTGVTASGRTDRGVHAKGQVIHFDTDLSLTSEQWLKAINANLPLDIRVLEAEAVPEGFHARFDVTGKRYDYYLSTREYDLFARNYITQYGYPLNLERMQDAAEAFLGTHDFTSFCSNTKEETPDQTRTIRRLEITEEDGIVHFVFEGDGFLRYMVRMIVGAILEAGREKMSREEIEEILAKRSKTVWRYKAPAEGLYLSEVTYKEQA